MLQAGDIVFNRFHVVAHRASGGFSHVHEGRDASTGSRVAISELHVVDPITKERLRRAWETLLRLKGHRRFPQPHEYGPHNGTMVLVQEFCDGETLDSLVQRRGGTLPEAEAVRYGCELLDALEALHAAGCYHRDIKPENLMVTSRGIVVLDLGLVHIQVYRASNLTQRVEMTPFYAAPEQWKMGPVSPATDLYAVGGTLYHILTGRWPLPFTGDRWQDESLVSNHPRTPISRFNPLLARLDGPIGRSLDPTSAKRPQSAAEMKQELATATGVSIAPTQLTAPLLHRALNHIQQQIQQWVRQLSGNLPQAGAKLRSGARALAAAALVALLLTVGVGAAKLLRPSQPATAEAAGPIVPTDTTVAGGPHASSSQRRTPDDGSSKPRLPQIAEGRGNDSTRAEVVGENVFVRDGAGTSAPVVAEGLMAGDPVTLSGQYLDGWYEITLGGGKHGWIFGAHLLTSCSRPDGVAAVVVPTPLLSGPGSGASLAELWAGKKLLTLSTAGPWLRVRCQADGRIAEGFVKSSAVQFIQRGSN